LRGEIEARAVYSILAERSRDPRWAQIIRRAGESERDAYPPHPNEMDGGLSVLQIRNSWRYSGGLASTTEVSI
jgi:hypothetical protein